MHSHEHAHGADKRPVGAVVVDVLYQGVTMMRESVRILLEGVPPDIRLENVSSVLVALPSVHSVHHLHVWQLDEHHRSGGERCRALEVDQCRGQH